LPREAGICPVKRLSSKSKLVRLERFPNVSGIGPDILFPGNDLHMAQQDVLKSEFATLQVQFTTIANKKCR
jgi:hypothetical protein